jgi:hypothetical protein
VTASDLYRREAAKADALAENFQDPASRDQLRKIARTYRRLAQHADQAPAAGELSPEATRTSGHAPRP